MKIKNLLVRSLTLAAGLCAASNIVNASQATFTDSWKDTAYLNTNDNSYGVKTAGTFSASVTASGVVGTNFDSNTVVSLTITLPNPVGAVTIFSGPLSAAKYAGGKAKSATFTSLVGATVTNGSATVSWTATTVTVTVSSKEDVLGLATPAAFDSAVAEPQTAELNLTVDTTGNPNGAGSAFAYDNTAVPVSGQNTSTVHKNPDGTTTTLYNGSLTGTADYSLALSITSPANHSKVGPAGSKITLKGHASDKDRVTDIECTCHSSRGRSVRPDSD